MADGQIVVTSAALRWRRAGSLAVTVFAHSGDSWLWLGGLGCAMLCGSPPQPVGRLLLAVVVSSSLAWALKRLVRRPRPPGSWGAAVRRLDPFSFPSGHAARAAAIAGTVALSAPLVWGAAVVGWAIPVSLIRVRLGMHRFVDIVVGWAIGVVIALFAVQVI